VLIEVFQLLRRPEDPVNALAAEGEPIDVRNASRSFRTGIGLISSASVGADRNGVMRRIGVRELEAESYGGNGCCARLRRVERRRLRESISGDENAQHREEDSVLTSAHERASSSKHSRRKMRCIGYDKARQEAAFAGCW